MADPVPYPFPGMNPWMQAVWSGAHSSLAVDARTRLNEVLPADLRAVVEETVVIRSDAAALREQADADLPAEAALKSAYQEIDLRDDPEVQRSLRIEEAQGGRVVTAIEWVSPTNKNDGRAAEQYRRKRRDWWRVGASTIDIDLTRGDPVARWELLRPIVLNGPPVPDFFVGVADAADLEKARGYKVMLRDRLPVIGVPLRAGEDWVELDLQALIEQVWRTGRYWQQDRHEPLDPPLAPVDAAWAAERLQGVG